LNSVLNNENDRQRAWEIRQQHDPRICFPFRVANTMKTEGFKNRPYSFANVSITAMHVPVDAEHCDARLLQTMLPAETPEKMCDLVDRLIERGCRGILVTVAPIVAAKYP